MPFRSARNDAKNPLIIIDFFRNLSELFFEFTLTCLKTPLKFHPSWLNKSDIRFVL